MAQHMTVSTILTCVTHCLLPRISLAAVVIVTTPASSENQQTLSQHRLFAPS